MLGKPSGSSFPWLWMTPLKLLQIGGGNGWELGWIIYGILLPKAFWIMTLGKKLIVQKTLLFFGSQLAQWSRAVERRLSLRQEKCGGLQSDLLLIQ